MSSGGVPDPGEFLDIIQTLFPAANGNRLATVDPAYSGSGRPRLTFDGETTMTTKAYPYLGSVPAASARVLLVPVGRSYVIIGTVH